MCAQALPEAGSGLTTKESCHHYQSFYVSPLPESVIGKASKGKVKGGGKDAAKGEQGATEEEARKARRRRRRRRRRRQQLQQQRQQEGKSKGQESEARSKANTLKQRKMMRIVTQSTKGLVLGQGGLFHR